MQVAETPLPTPEIELLQPAAPDLLPEVTAVDGLEPLPALDTALAAEPVAAPAAR